MFSSRTNWNLAANRLSEALDRYRASGKPLLDLTISNPADCGFECDGRAILQALANPGALGYQPDAKGLESARRAVTSYYAARGEKVPAEDIVLTTGTSESYGFVFRLLCNPSDELLVPAPSYPLFDFLADLQDVKPVRYPLVYDHGWQIDFHALEKAISGRTRGVIVVHPNNPTGNFCGPEEIQKLSEICSARGMAIIADEVFLDFALGEERPASFVKNSHVLTFALSGLSKISGLPQMKLGWIVVSGPEGAKKDALGRLEVIADTFLSVSAPAQWAAPILLEQRHEFQKRLMERIRRNLVELDEQLAQQASCTRLQMDGGWYAVLRVPAVGSDEELAIALLTEKGVYVHPGHFYDFPSAGHVVVSLITPQAAFARGVKLAVSA